MPSEELLDKYKDLRDEYNAFVRQLTNKSKGVEKIRLELATKFLIGHGVEISAFHRPNPLPLYSTVDYIDQVSVANIKKRFPKMSEFHCVSLKLLDDGEGLSKIKDEQYDFLIANHMLEHTQNLFKTIQNHLRVIKQDGYLFYAVPDKRYTFDKDRELTTYDHLKIEYLYGSEQFKYMHYIDVNKNINKLVGEKLITKTEEDMNTSLDTHFHVWTPKTFKEHIQLAIDDNYLHANIVEHVESSNWESITILKKIRLYD
jgi:ubiquinone/menaquinone biosynthesis C-methylase UbiE